MTTALIVRVGLAAVFLGRETGAAGESENGTVKLPQPQTAGGVSVEEALAGRRSVRDYSAAFLSLSLADLGHLLRLLADGDARSALSRVALNQSAIEDAVAVIAISGVYERTTGKYGERGVRYVCMEAGHASQNIYLQAVPLGIGTVSIGSFDDGGVRRVMRMEEDECPSP